jgi:hypothetical protein
MQQAPQNLNIQNVLLQELNKSKKSIFEGLLNEPYLNKIPESLFVNYFLPFFAGQASSPNWVIEWIAIAGSPMARVAVFDDNTQEVLYIVPSLLNTQNLILPNRGANFAAVFNNYSQMSNNLPVQGLNFLIKALNDKNEELLKNIDFNESTKTWKEIFQRYSLIPKDSALNSEKAQDFLDFE